MIQNKKMVSVCAQVQAVERLLPDAKHSANFLDSHSGLRLPKRKHNLLGRKRDLFMPKSSFDSGQILSRFSHFQWARFLVAGQRTTALC